VQVAADVGDLDQRRRHVAVGRLAQLRRQERDPQHAVHGFLVRRVRERLERRHVRVGAGGAQQRRPEALRLGRDELDRHALDRHADRRLDERDDLRQRREPVDRTRVRADDGQPLARVAPAPRVARHLAVQGGRDPAGELPGAVQREPALRRGSGVARQGVDQLRLDLRPDAGHVPQPTLRGGLPQLLGRPHAERARDVYRPAGADPEVAPEADETRRQVPFEFGQLGDAAGLEQLP
jgi:hypothetical protein